MKDTITEKHQVNANSTRVDFVDITRFFAIFMVIVIHSCEFFYIGDRQFSPQETFWSGFIDSALRIAVPLFVMMSSYLLVPTKESMETFYSKRLKRILIPFAVWSLAYATLPVIWGGFGADEIGDRLLKLTYMFNDGHLWYVYMFVGVSLFIPIISPWLQTATRRQLHIVLGIWFVSLFQHYIEFFGDTNEWVGVLGACKWNEFSVYWYFSGFIGYVVLAYYIRKYINWSRAKSLMVGLPMFVFGWAVAYYWFMHYYSTGNLYVYEIAWRYCTPNVAIASFGFFIMMKALKMPKGIVGRLIGSVAKYSYAIYLAHIFILNAVHAQLQSIESVPLKIASYSVLTFLLTYLLVCLLSFLPKSKYWLGK